MVIVLDNIVL